MQLRFLFRDKIMKFGIWGFGNDDDTHYLMVFENNFKGAKI